MWGYPPTPEQVNPPMWSCGCAEDAELERMVALMEHMSQWEASRVVWGDRGDVAA